MDRIVIKELLVRCRIGVGEEERREKQDVLINLVLSADLRAPGRSDRIEDSIDYRALKKRILAATQQSQHHLVETLAERLAALCLEDGRVEEVMLSVEKPSALRFARSVGVEITRRRRVTAFVGVGSNVEPEANVPRALERLAGQVSIHAVSTFYRSEALGPGQRPSFVNGVLEIETDLEPLDLKFGVLRRIEAELGRRRSADRFAPRSIDLDLLLYGECVENSAALVLPDPDVESRAFLAVPLAELAGDLVLPVSGRPARDVARALGRAALEPLPRLSLALRRFVHGR